MKFNSGRTPKGTLFVTACAGLLSVSALFGEQRWEQAAFTGGDAVRHLKDTANHESLGEAITMARYSIREIEGAPEKAQAKNSNHGLSATFDSEGLHLKAVNEDRESYQSNWRLESAGGQKVTTGELHHHGQRIEIVRPGLTEWFVNRPTGLEHGFTLASRPAGAGEQLQLSVALTGDLMIAVSEDGQHAELRDQETGVKVLDYDKLRVWDAIHRELPARMIAAKGGMQLQLEVDDAGAHYPLTIDPTFTQQAYLKANNIGSNDQFGFAVAVSGDTVVVGARGEASSATGGGDDNSQFFAGAAYVFTRSGTTWSEQAFLKADNAGTTDEFGRAVAISGETIVIGARGERSNPANGADDDTTFEAGAAYVFVRSGTAWSQQAFLKADNAGPGDRFGTSVAISGNTVVVGAEREDDGGSNSGAAYVFARSGTTWTQQAFLKAENAEAGDEFGGSVAVSGNTVVVGANEEASSAEGGGSDNSAEEAGAAYVFVRSGTTWTQQAFLKASNAEAGDEFGTSVSVSADTIVIGAPDEDSNLSGDASNNSAANAGAVYVFTRNGVTWGEQALLKADNAGGADNFGQSVAVSGNRLIVGADGEDSSATGGGSDNSVGSAGAAYVFERSGVTWSQQALLKADNAGIADSLGQAVAVSGNTVIVGAHLEDSGTVTNGADGSSGSSGAAYVFQSDDLGPLNFEITEIEVDGLQNTLTLTWRSTPGATYRVDYSQDLLVWSGSLEAGIAHDVAGGGLTSREFDLNGTDLDGQPKLFVRVVEE